MTAPDPRLNEIQARIGRLLSTLAWAETPEERDDAENELTADVRYLLAELRKAHEAIERVEALADAFVQRGEHLIEFAKTAPEDVAESLTESGGDFLHKGRLIRAAVSAAKGDGE